MMRRISPLMIIVLLLLSVLATIPIVYFLHSSASGGAVVQSAFQNANDNTACSTSCTAASFGSSVTSGDTLVVLIGYYNANPPKITDTLGTVYQEAGSSANCEVAGTTNGYVITVFTGVASSSGSDSVSFQFSKNNNPDVAIYELSGVSSMYPVFSASNQASFNCPSSTTSSVNPSLTIGASGIVLALVIQVSASQTSWTAGSGYTLVTGSCSQGSAHYGCSEYEQGASGTTTAPMTYGTSGPAIELAVTYSNKCSGACIVQSATTSATVVSGNHLSLPVNGFASTNDYLVVVATAYGVDIAFSASSVSDSLGNTWTLQTGQSGGAVNHLLAIGIWTSPVTSLSPDTISLNGDPSVANNLTLTLYEVSGIVLNLAATGYNAASGTSWSMPSLTAGSSGIVIGGWAYYNSGTSMDEAAPSFTMATGSVYSSCAFADGCAEFTTGFSGSTTVQMTSAISATHAIGSAITFAAAPSQLLPHVGIVQYNLGENTNVSVNWPVYSGDTMVVSVGYYAPSILPVRVQDSQANTYVSVATETVSSLCSDNVGMQVQFFVATLTQNGINNVTVYDSGATHTDIAVYEVAGVALPISASSGGTGCSTNSPWVTPYHVGNSGVAIASVETYNTVNSYFDTSVGYFQNLPYKYQNVGYDVCSQTLGCGYGASEYETGNSGYSYTNSSWALGATNDWAEEAITFSASKTVPAYTADVVQSNYYPNSTTPFTSESLKYVYPVAAGNRLVVGVMEYSGTNVAGSSSVTDTMGNTYSLIKQDSVSSICSTTHAVTVSVYSATASSSGSDSVKIADSTGQNAVGLGIYELSGVSSAITFAIGNGCPPTPPQVNSLAFGSSGITIGFVGFDNYGTGTTYDTGVGYEPSLPASLQHDAFNMGKNSPTGCSACNSYGNSEWSPTAQQSLTGVLFGGRENYVEVALTFMLASGSPVYPSSIVQHDFEVQPINKWPNGPADVCTGTINGTLPLLTAACPSGAQYGTEEVFVAAYSNGTITGVQDSLGHSLTMLQAQSGGGVSMSLWYETLPYSQAATATYTVSGTGFGGATVLVGYGYSSYVDTSGQGHGTVGNFGSGLSGSPNQLIFGIASNGASLSYTGNALETTSGSNFKSAGGYGFTSFSWSGGTSSTYGLWVMLSLPTTNVGMVESTLHFAVTAGDPLVALVTYHTPSTTLAIPSVYDSQGNLWTMAYNYTQSNLCNTGTGSDIRVFTTIANSNGVDTFYVLNNFNVSQTSIAFYELNSGVNITSLSAVTGSACSGTLYTTSSPLLMGSSGIFIMGASNWGSTTNYLGGNWMLGYSQSLPFGLQSDAYNSGFGGSTAGYPAFGGVGEWVGQGYMEMLSTGLASHNTAGYGEVLLTFNSLPAPLQSCQMQILTNTSTDGTSVGTTSGVTTSTDGSTVIGGTTTTTVYVNSTTTYDTTTTVYANYTSSLFCIVTTYTPTVTVTTTFTGTVVTVISGTLTTLTYPLTSTVFVTTTVGVAGGLLGFPNYLAIFIFMVLVAIMLAILYKWFKRYGPDDYGKGIEV